MNIYTTQFVLELQRFEIYIAGCKGVDGVHCKGCHNPQTWNFNTGKPLTDTLLTYLLEKANQPIVKNIWILGGEPLDSPIYELLPLIYALQYAEKPIWLFTRREFKEVPEVVKRNIQYLKTGAYREDLLTDNNIQFGVKLASSNQRITNVSL